MKYHDLRAALVQIYELLIAGNVRAATLTLFQLISLIDRDREAHEARRQQARVRASLRKSVLAMIGGKRR